MSQFCGMGRTVYEYQKEQTKLVAKRLKWARELVGLTPTELAADIGVDTTAIRHIEYGNRLPSLHVMMSLCHVLRVSPQYLLWGSLEAVDPELAGRLKSAHPELQWPAAPAAPPNTDTEARYNDQRARIRPRGRPAFQPL